MNYPAPLRHLPVLIIVVGAVSAVHADISSRPEVMEFIRSVSARDSLDAAELDRLFKQVDIQQKILAAMDHPAESMPWREYRKNLLTEEHIRGGVEFWGRNRAALDETSARYGVAPEMIVAIIGVESRYGRIPGSYRVIDALATLSFGYPRRADYFRRELEEYLLMCREEKIIPTQPRGSYAGAMGMPQFMPSSYRRYAADLDGDHRRNIWTNPADAIASVANFFAHSGWRTGETVAVPATVKGADVQALLGPSEKPDRAIGELRKLGVEATATLPDAARARLITLETEAGPEFWLGMHNFDVITRYNYSPLYAMAAYQLSNEILARSARR